MKINFCLIILLLYISNLSAMMYGGRLDSNEIKIQDYRKELYQHLFENKFDEADQTKRKLEMEFGNSTYMIYFFNELILITLLFNDYSLIKDLKSYQAYLDSSSTQATKLVRHYDGLSENFFRLVTERKQAILNKIIVNEKGNLFQELLALWHMRRLNSEDDQIEINNKIKSYKEVHGEDENYIFFMRHLHKSIHEINLKLLIGAAALVTTKRLSIENGPHYGFDLGLQILFHKFVMMGSASVIFPGRITSDFTVDDVEYRTGESLIVNNFNLMFAYPLTLHKTTLYPYLGISSVNFQTDEENDESINVSSSYYNIGAALDIWEFAYKTGLSKFGISPRFVFGGYIPTKTNNNAHDEIRYHFRIQMALGGGGLLIH